CSAFGVRDSEFDRRGEPESTMNPRSKAWPWWAITLWGAALVAACTWLGPGFVRSLWPPDVMVADFFQAWASARFYLDGVRVYARQERAVARYLVREGARKDLSNAITAPPPTSVLLVLPLACLDYPAATLVWNLLGLAALAVSLGL